MKNAETIKIINGSGLYCYLNNDRCCVIKITLSLFEKMIYLITTLNTSA
jgi:hypothetical protein